MRTQNYQVCKEIHSGSGNVFRGYSAGHSQITIDYAGDFKAWYVTRTSVSGKSFLWKDARWHRTLGWQPTFKHHWLAPGWYRTRREAIEALATSLRKIDK